MIELEGLTKEYKLTKTKSVRALKGVTMQLPDRGMVFIVGRSGGGKSTLLHILGGLDTFDGGSMRVDGRSVAAFTATDWDAYRNFYAGFIFQDHHLMHECTVGENIRIALSLQAESEDRTSVDARIAEALARVGLEGYEDRKINQLSGGQRQRVSIARALAKNARMLLADEPTANLDADTAREIFELLRSLSAEKLVVVVSHDTAAAAQYADMAFALHAGVIAQAETYRQTQDATETFDFFAQPHGAMPAATMWRLIGRFFKRRAPKLIAATVFGVLALTVMTGVVKLWTYRPYGAINRSMQYEGASIVGKPKGGFTRAEIDELQRKFPNRAFYPIESGRFIGGHVPELREADAIYFYGNSTGICVVDEAGLSKLGYDVVAGSYAAKDWGENDIAVSRYTFEVFQTFGYRKSDDAAIEQIDTYDDLIGKNLNGHTVRAVIDTHIDEAFFADSKQYAPDGNNKISAAKKLLTETYFYYDNLHTLTFTPIAGMRAYTNVLCTTADSRGNKAFARYILKSGAYVFTNSFAVTAAYYVADIRGAPIGIALHVFLYLFSLGVAAYLLGTFVLSVFKESKKQVGILRSMGVSNRSIAVMYLWQIAILSAVWILLTVALFGGAVMPYIFLFFDMSTCVLPFPMFVLNWAEVCILIGTVLAIDGIAFAVPMCKLTKKWPARLLNDILQQ